MAGLQIKVQDTFPHLAHSPLVEMVIDIRARPLVELQEEGLKTRLECRLEGYTLLDSMHDLRVQQNMETSGSRDLVWKGLRFQSNDRHHIVQFNRDGLVFSRLEPYQGWNPFIREGLHLWSVYSQLARPSALYRIGLRSINRISVHPDDRGVEVYTRSRPTPPPNLDLPLLAYLYQDTFAVPDYPYAIHVVETIQPSDGGSGKEPDLIFDIDVFTVPEAKLEEDTLNQRLQEMRWLKNYVFFGSMTKQAIESFR